MIVCNKINATLDDSSLYLERGEAQTEAIALHVQLQWSDHLSRGATLMVADNLRSAARCPQLLISTKLTRFSLKNDRLLPLCDFHDLFRPSCSQHFSRSTFIDVILFIFLPDEIFTYRQFLWKHSVIDSAYNQTLIFARCAEAEWNNVTKNSIPLVVRNSRNTPLLFLPHQSTGLINLNMLLLWCDNHHDQY